MALREDDLEDCELDIVDEEEPVPFLRPITGQHLGFFTGRVGSSGAVGEPVPDAPCDTPVGRVARDMTPEPRRFAHGDKSILYVGLEELFHVDPKTPQTLPLCAGLLEEYFGIPGGAFRPSQQEVCLGVLQGHHTLAVCPTGWGKSLCYQFPMLVHRLLFRNAFEQWQQKCDAAAREASAAADDDDEAPTGRRELATRAALPPMPVSRFSLVISPLLSLMSDQMEKIGITGALKAVALSSQTGADREDRILQELTSPTCSIDVVFISPEKLISHRRLRDVLLAQHRRLAMVCVDEVHCVSKWAYDFRPSFLYVARLLDDLVHAGGARLGAAGLTRTEQALDFYGTQDAAPRTTYLCLTATASKSVITDLCRAFHIDTTILCTDQARHNLRLESVDTLARAAAFSGATSGADASKPTPPPSRVIQEALLEAVTSLPHPMIIYVQSRADADEVASYIGSRVGSERGPAAGEATDQPTEKPDQASVFGRYDSSSGSASKTGCTADGPRRAQKRLVVRCYHAALSRSQRTSTQHQFLHDKVDVLVATVAFGMGIDKRNIRSIVHAQAPGSLEGYVQEVGRAGRDGQPSQCRVLYNPFDYFDLRCRLWASLLAPSEMRDIVRAITACRTSRAAEDGSGVVALVSCARIATTLAIAEETVETILFLLLSLAPTGKLTGKRYYKSVRGGASLGFKVVVAASSANASENGRGGNTNSSTEPPPPRAPPRKRARAGAHAAALLPEGSGVSSLLAQLHARDPVMDALVRASTGGVESLIDLANQLDMTTTDLQYRLDDLSASGAVTLYPRGHALLIEMGPDAAELGNQEVQDELATWLFDLYNGRLARQADGLCGLFEVLRAPSHEGIHRMLTDASVAQWTPPAPRLSKTEAVFIANDFVEKNRMRVSSTYDAARALLGVMPKSQIAHGKFAGQLPLSHSWYVRSPHFGALREFDLEWVLRVLSAHELDSVSLESVATPR